MSKNREFDIIVYGASGFTGRLVAEYMQNQYGRSVNWAMAGRSAEKLAEVRDLIGADPQTPLVVADAADPASVRQMVSRASVICTTVGPYQLYGSDIVAACAELGTDYVDLSGEPGWMHEMIGAHDAAANASGARIVHSCGFDSIPFDLGVLFLQDAAKEKFGETCPRVRGRVRAMNGEFSGGTAASLGATMEALGKTQNYSMFWPIRSPWPMVSKVRRSPMTANQSKMRCSGSGLRHLLWPPLTPKMCTVPMPLWATLMVKIFAMTK